MIYYSKTTKGFYSTEINGTNIPSDKVEITKEYYNELFAEQSKGKEIKPDNNGYPIAVNRVPDPITWDQIKSQRDGLLKDSDWSVAVDVNPKPSKEAWLTYRQTLRDIPSTFKTPEEVTWPEKP